MISGFESYKVRVSAALQCIYCVGKDCRVQIAHVERVGTIAGLCSAALAGCERGLIPGGIYGRGHQLKSSLPSDLYPWKLESLSECISSSPDPPWLGPGDLILDLWHIDLDLLAKESV